MPHPQTQRALSQATKPKQLDADKGSHPGRLASHAASTGRDARAWARLGVASAPPASLAAAHRDIAAAGLHEPLTPAPTAPSQMTTVAQRLQVRLQSHDTEAERREVRQRYARRTARTNSRCRSRRLRAWPTAPRPCLSSFWARTMGGPSHLKRRPKWRPRAPALQLSRC